MQEYTSEAVRVIEVSIPPIFATGNAKYRTWNIAIYRIVLYYKSDMSQRFSRKGNQYKQILRKRGFP
jgi:hypothetical protein